MSEISLSVKLSFILENSNTLQGNSLQISALPSLSLVIFEISTLLETTTKFSGVAEEFSTHFWDPSKPQHPEMEKILARVIPYLTNPDGGV